MAVFNKKPESMGAEDTDFVRIPPGARITAGPDGRLSFTFAGDMSFGESLPELAEINCGRNLSVDAGVTLRADVIRVKATFEVEAGSKVYAKEVEAERILSRKGQIETRTLSGGQIELLESRVVADLVTARETVTIERGEIEIGTVAAKLLTIAKGTTANILVTEVQKLDGAVTKGGYENFGELLSKVLRYHSEILNDRFLAEARKLAPADDEEPLDPAVLARVVEEGRRLRGLYADREVPREIAELLGHIEAHRVANVRQNLTPIFQRVTAQGKLPEAAGEVFRELQKLLRDSSRTRKEARTA